MNDGKMFAMMQTYTVFLRDLETAYRCTGVRGPRPQCASRKCFEKLLLLLVLLLYESIHAHDAEMQLRRRMYDLRAVVLKGENDWIVGHLESRLCDGFDHFLQKTELINDRRETDHLIVISHPSH